MEIEKPDYSIIYIFIEGIIRIQENNLLTPILQTPMQHIECPLQTSMTLAAVS